MPHVDRRSGAVRWTIACALLFAPACSETADRQSPPGDVIIACGPDERLVEERGCVLLGLPVDLPCPPGELALGEGVCQPAGVPPASCAAGFVSDGRGGCDPVLPAEACPAGQMAIPGESACRDVAPCGSEPWGDIPLDPTTQHVDRAYSGVGSDGSRQRPWTTIGQALSAAEPGAVVAVAMGRYAESLVIEKPVRLWGRCPRLVEIVGASGTEAAIQVLRLGDAAAEIRGVAVTGPVTGLSASGALTLSLDRLWIHDAGGIGLDITNAIGPTRVALSGSLIEGNTLLGVGVAGASVAVESTVVRDTQPDAQGAFGRGVDVEYDPATRARSSLTMRSSLLERNHETGLFVAGADADVEGTVVRDTQPAPMRDGRGINLRIPPDTEERANLIFRASLLERNHGLGIAIIGSDALLEGSVVRDTLSASTGVLGRGIAVQDEASNGNRANLTLRASLVERNQEDGLFLAGSDALLEGVIVRGTTQNLAGSGGRGVGAQNDPQTRARAKLTLRGSLVEQNNEAGCVVVASDAAFETTVVRDNLPNQRGQFGRGIDVELELIRNEPARASLWATLVEENHDVGVFVAGSEAKIDASIVRTTAGAEGQYGDGIAAIGLTLATRVELADTLVSSNTRAGALFVSAPGRLSRVTFVSNRLGLVLQGSPTPSVDESNVFAGNVEQDEYSDGPLAVPNSMGPLP